MERDEAALPAAGVRWARQFEWFAIIGLFAVASTVCFFNFKLLVGDWDFWTDWKDQRWWLTLTPPVHIMMIGWISAFFWYAFRLPIGATFAMVALFSSLWTDRIFNWSGSGGFATYPQNFIWPAVMFPSAILLDLVLLFTRNGVATALIGGMVFAFAFWLANHVLIAPFNQPVEYQGSLMTLADLQGFEYIRTSTPEYLRIIERGTFRLGLGTAPLLATFFAAFLSIVGFYIWWLIGKWATVSLPKKFVKYGEL